MGTATAHHRRAASWLAAVAIAFGATAVAPSCSTGDQRSAFAGPIVQVVERDFSIRLSKHHVAAGPVLLQVRNEGPVAHELLVIREQDGPLPMRADDVTIDEDAIEDITVGVIEPEAAGSTHELQLDLEPGSYSVVCNMSGHFMGGMYADLEVTA